MIIPSNLVRSVPEYYRSTYNCTFRSIIAHSLNRIYILTLCGSVCINYTLFTCSFLPYALIMTHTFSYGKSFILEKYENPEEIFEYFQ